MTLMILMMLIVMTVKKDNADDEREKYMKERHVATFTWFQARI